MANSSAVKTLQEFGLETEKVLNYHDNFGLLEREIPDLCADRVDYSLREMPKDLAAQILKGLRVKDERIICGDFETAVIFARKFLNLQQDHWGSYEAVSRYFYFSQMLKRALSLDAISLEDFLKNDIHVMSLVEVSSDVGIRQALKFLERKYMPRVKDGQTIFKKFRYIDPLFLDGHEELKLSSVDKEFGKILEEAKKENEQGVLVEAIKDL